MAIRRQHVKCDRGCSEIPEEEVQARCLAAGAHRCARGDRTSTVARAARWTHRHYVALSTSTHRRLSPRALAPTECSAGSKLRSRWRSRLLARVAECINALTGDDAFAAYLCAAALALRFAASISRDRAPEGGILLGPQHAVEKCALDTSRAGAKRESCGATGHRTAQVLSPE